MSVPGRRSRSMIFLTASAAVTFTGCPELCPSPCPGAPGTIGLWQATPGNCEDWGMPAMSEPRAITGFLEPRVGSGSGPLLERYGGVQGERGECQRQP